MIATVKSGGMHWKDSFTGFKDRLEKQMPHFESRGIGAIGDRKEGLELWQFSGDARVAFNPAILKRVFLDLKVQKVEIEVDGMAVRSDKVPEHINFVCHHSSWKVRLQPPKRRDGEADKGPDPVTQIGQKLDEGKPHFQILGEVTWTSAGHTLVVEKHTAIGAPQTKSEGLK